MVGIMGIGKFWAAILGLLALMLTAAPALANSGKTAWDGEWEGTLRHPDLACSPCRVSVSISNGITKIRGPIEIHYLTIDADGAVVAEAPIHIAGNPVRSSCRVFGKAQGSATLPPSVLTPATENDCKPLNAGEIADVVRMLA